MSSIAWACFSENSKPLIRAALASFWSAEDRIIEMIWSITSRARLRPSRMWALSSARAFSKRHRLRITSWRWSRKSESISFRVSLLGLLSTRASMLAPKETSRSVCL